KFGKGSVEVFLQCRIEDPAKEVEQIHLPDSDFLHAWFSEMISKPRSRLDSHHTLARPKNRGGCLPLRWWISWVAHGRSVSAGLPLAEGPESRPRRGTSPLA